MAIVILAVLIGLGAFFAVQLFQDTHEHKERKRFSFLSFVSFGIGFIADFLDTLGIGSFLVTTLLFKLTGYLKDDSKLPGTLNVAHGLPTVVEAIFFLTVVKVDAVTLISMVLASVLGTKIGANIVSRLNRVLIQRIMSFALLLTSLLMVAKVLGWIQLLGGNNTALGLSGWALLIGIVGNFVLGALMAAGVGLYSPCMVMVYLLGMNPLAAFPIMMTSCAALMPMGSVTYVKKGVYEKSNIWWLILGGILGVVVAAIFVKSLSMTVLSWIIIAAGLITAISLWRSSMVATVEKN